MPYKLAIALCGCLWLFGFSAARARAAETQVAVASNFEIPAQAIAAAFHAATGDTAILSFGSTGQFYIQICHGAPFDVFLSADALRPRKIEADGLAVPNTRFTYAIGRIVLYSTTPGLAVAGAKILETGNFSRLAIADPAVAPYGLAAVQTLKAMHLYSKVEPKIVQGANIGQTYEFTQSGAAELGFVALSEVIGSKGGSRWNVPASDYAPIVQQAVLLKSGEHNPAATAFVHFLKSPQAAAIIRKFGYSLP